VILLILGVALAIVWYFIIISVIGFLVGARPCRDCQRDLIAKRSQEDQA
jgi:hypothetical protein